MACKGTNNTFCNGSAMFSDIFID
uniref:Mitogen-activated protein kinase kinase kinase ANP1 n=1 Tax=Rhizophora mucronata TaxID=61149 RepID=A0A2P2JKU1_RHIMU